MQDVNFISYLQKLMIEKNNKYLPKQPSYFRMVETLFFSKFKEADKQHHKDKLTRKT